MSDWIDHKAVVGWDAGDLWLSMSISVRFAGVLSTEFVVAGHLSWTLLLSMNVNVSARNSEKA